MSAERTKSAVIVSHTHWDREWYRPFEAFRARLVDTVDLVLDQLAADPGWAFLLDGQTVVVEDYLAVRPERRAELESACRERRLSIGPWYVQPDSLLPSGEAHIRNLLIGRRAGEAIGPVSRVAYTPDSFGHPAQFPQLFAGFGLGPFVYWRGNGDELDRLDPVWRWVAPDGTAVTACHLGEGYFAAAYLGDDVGAAVDRLVTLADKLGGPVVLLMNGIDHAPPDVSTAAVAASLASRTGWEVRRGLLEDYAAQLPDPVTEHRGELVGGKVAFLLPGVWSTRTYLKRRNRRAQTALEGWAEPWTAIARGSDVPDERPALGLAWRSLLVNQAHDSICGCSTDAVHEQMLGRYETAEGLARETTSRVLERLAGLGPRRRERWDDGVDVAVFNPSPHPRTDLVRFAFDAHPLFMIGNKGEELDPLVMASLLHQGITVDGRPARVVTSDDPGRVRVIPEQRPWEVEFVAEDVPAFGWRRFRLAPGPRAGAEKDDGRSISIGRLTVEVADDGTLTLSDGASTWAGLLGVEDIGDRGDSYDFDGVDGPPPELTAVDVTRRSHPDGVRELHVRRLLSVPARLAPSRDTRGEERATLTLDTLVRLIPGVDRVDVDVSVDNTADDHRLRLLFPAVGEAVAATTFDVVRRQSGVPDGADWLQPPVPTFCQQGWVAVGALTVGAPDLPEAEILADGTIALTLIRSVGWLSAADLHSRSLPAGPGMPTPAAQCRGLFRTELHLWCGDGTAGTRAVAARDAELGLRAVAAGPAPLLPDGAPALELSPSTLVLSACKPAEDGDALIVRILNVEDQPATAALRVRGPVRSAVAVRLDEQPVEDEVTVDGATVTFPVPPHALRTVAIT